MRFYELAGASVAALCAMGFSLEAFHRRPCIRELAASLLRDGFASPTRGGRTCFKRDATRIATRRQSRARGPALLFLAMTMSWPAEARCHIFRVWHYPKPQRCFVALANHSTIRPIRLNPETFHERIDIPVPDLEFTPCPDGDERLIGIARLRALEDAR